MSEFTKNRMQTYWEESQVFIKKKWPKFTDVEFKRINGDFDRFLEYLIEFYNDYPRTEAVALDNLNKLYNHLDEKQFQK